MHAQELQLVRDPSSDPARQGVATVEELREQGFALCVAGAPLERLARRAASCLLAPAPGDEVWFAIEGERCYVLAVLERAASEQPAQLVLEGDAELTTPGKLTLRADAGLTLRTDARLDTHSDELQVRARLGRVLLDEAQLVARTLWSQVTHSTLVAKVRELLVERLSVHAKTSHRSVEQLDKVEAHTLDYRAEGTAHIGANQTLVKGGDLVKVDGGQIHLG